MCSESEALLRNGAPLQADPAAATTTPRTLAAAAAAAGARRPPAAAAAACPPVLPPAHTACASELASYLDDSFGNATRIDYGTGHETTFVALMLCLAKLGVFADDDQQARPAAAARARQRLRLRPLSSPPPARRRVPRPWSFASLWRTCA